MQTEGRADMAGCLHSFWAMQRRLLRLRRQSGQNSVTGVDGSSNARAECSDWDTIHGGRHSHCPARYFAQYEKHVSIVCDWYWKVESSIQVEHHLHMNCVVPLPLTGNHEGTWSVRDFALCFPHELFGIRWSNDSVAAMFQRELLLLFHILPACLSGFGGRSSSKAPCGVRN